MTIELKNFAVRLGFINGSLEHLPSNLTLLGLDVLKEIASREESDFNRKVAIMLIALLWTHSDTCYRDALRQGITPILATMGFSPSNLMIDECLKAQGIYSEQASFFDKIRILIHDAKNEVEVGGEKYLLTAFQMSVWEAIEEKRFVGISAPTSAGKSFLIYLKIVDLIINGATSVVYVVPTLSLISQVTVDLTGLLKKHQLYKTQVLNSYDEKASDVIYVVTQERAIVLFSEIGLKELNLLVVDEVQNLEKVSSDGEDRSKILYDVLMDIRNDVKVEKIILSGPRLKRIGNLGFRVFGEISDERTTEAPPVLSLTYAVSKLKKKHILKLYCSLIDEPLALEIKNASAIQGLGQVSYTEKFNSYLHHVLSSLSDDLNIVFSPTATQARKSATEFAKSIKNDGEPVDENLASLATYLRNSVHPNYELAQMVESGIAYHTGRTPLHVRKTLEFATGKNLIGTLFCTTTLMQGVNLPAKNVVVRNPKLFTQKSDHNFSLSPYEFANLRGRAGRLLTDFIGRTVVLDEEAFSGEDDFEKGESLFTDDYKEIGTGYQEIYKENVVEIEETLNAGVLTSHFTSKAIITFIRQSIYRHGSQAEIRLSRVGIFLPPSVFNKVVFSLSNLTVSREVIFANRYWDPLDLQLLYNMFRKNDTDFPTNVFAKDLCSKLLKSIMMMRDILPFYFNKYLKAGLNDKYLYGVAKSAEGWCREIPLRDILVGRFGESSIDINNQIDINDQIDSEIEKLTKYVSFGLPMLLKPLADMKSMSMSIISSIEWGMYHPLSKHLSDRGVPRETSIKLRKAIVGSAEQVELKNFRLDDYLEVLSIWERRQIQHLLTN